MKTICNFRNLSVIATILILAINPVQAGNVAAINEVLKLHRANVNEDTIVAYIQGQNVNYDLNADDILNLTKQGVASSILNAMLASRALPVVSTPTAAQAVQQQETRQTASVSTYTAPVVRTVTVTQPTVTVQPVAVAPALSADAAYFYQELSPYGRWILAEDSQWYWQPSVSLNSSNWRPYWDKGRWIYTDNGWYWASDYPWGWAAFHYGRWRLHPIHGWLWYPDRVWAPAWVAWRTGSEHCGWAPLPPGVHYDTAGGRFTFHGKRVEANFDFGLDWLHFNFCLVKEMGDHNRIRIRKDDDVKVLFRKTTVINNYELVKRPDKSDWDPSPRIFNHGIDPGKVARFRGRNIEPMKIEDLRKPVSGRSSERMDTRNKTIEVYRPRLNEPPRR